MHLWARFEPYCSHIEIAKAVQHNSRQPYDCKQMLGSRMLSLPARSPRPQILVSTAPTPLCHQEQVWVHSALMARKHSTPTSFDASCAATLCTGSWPAARYHREKELETRKSICILEHITQMHAHEILPSVCRPDGMCAAPACPGCMLFYSKLAPWPPSGLAIMISVGHRTFGAETEHANRLRSLPLHEPVRCEELRPCVHHQVAASPAQKVDRASSGWKFHECTGLPACTERSHGQDPPTPPHHRQAQFCSGCPEFSAATWSFCRGLFGRCSVRASSAPAATCNRKCL